MATPTGAAETPAGWLAAGVTGNVVVVANPVVVGSVLVVVGPMLVVVRMELVVVGSSVVVVNSVVVGSVVLVEAAVVVETAVVVGAVVVLGVVTGAWPVAPGMASVLVTVVLLQGDASGVACRPPVVIGQLAADGLVSGLLVGEMDWVVDSWVVVVVVTDVGAGAGLVVTVGRATPGVRFGGEA